MARLRTLGWLGLVLAGSAGLRAAEPDNPHVWQPRVRSVAVFKNGLGFFIREGEVTLRDGWCVAGAVPPALFGTLAIYALDEGCAVDVVGAGRGELVEFDGRDGPRDLPAKRARLEAWRELKVQLTWKPDETERSVAGRLSDVTDRFGIVEADGRLTATPLETLTRMQVLDYPLRVHVAGAPPGGVARLGMAYLRKGVTWIPEYSLRVVDDAAAELVLRATLVNEVEDLVGADVHFVVGVPSFVHAEFLTPLAVGQVIRTVAAALPAGFDSQILSNAIVTRAGVAADARPEGPATADVPVTADAGGLDRIMAGLPRLEGAGASDFTVYTREAMTVRQGEKALVTVFGRRVAYAHAYRWDSPGALRHYLVLRNETDTPWTTGPVLAVSGDRPLCGDTICYTPRGSSYHLPVTTAVNLATDATELEVNRELKAHEPGHNVFLDLVTIEGRLVVRNHEPRPVELGIRRAVAGRPLQASEGGRLHQDTQELRLLERRGSVSWQVTLAPGEQRVLTYRYERYVPSQ